jgi:hypothetical protein
MALLWFGLLAAPLAWTAQLIVGPQVEETACTSRAGGRWDIPLDAWHIGVTVGCAAIALAGAAAAAIIFRETRRQVADARGRIAFMAVWAVLISGVFLTLILLGGVAAIFHTACAK